MTLSVVRQAVSDPDTELYCYEEAAALSRRGWTVLPPASGPVRCLVEGCRVTVADGHRICTFDRRSMGVR